MKMTKIWMVAILFLALFAVSCDKEEDPVNEAQVLVEYLESADGGNYAGTAMPAIVTAEHVKTLNTTGANYIIDIRSAADFALGHIENAVNVAATEVLSHLEGTAADDSKDEIVIVCYSGQTAAWATCLLRLAGYDNASSMKFGMCSWNNDFAGSWNSNTKSTYSSEFTKDATEKGAEGDLPVLNTGFTTGKEILDARIDAVFAEGFDPAKITNATVFGSLSSYYIANYWAEADYTGIGHIPGAMQYTPKVGMSLDGDLKTLPTDQAVVVYCWTGQTSANMAAYLRVIGYDAKTLLFGANGMIYNDLSINKWSPGAIMGYDYVTE
ncbi:MAG: rhodanese-like domain-containing protein [Bacteroidota bacterium]